MQQTQCCRSLSNNKLSLNVAFKNSDNKKRFKFNSEVIDKLQSVVATSTLGEKDWLLQEAINLLEERNRKIQIVVRGWLVDSQK